MDYTLTIDNSSTNSAQAIVYLVDPNAAFQQYSLVWNSTPLNPNTTGRFTWEEDYDFVWGPMPEIRPGAIFHTAQSVVGDASNRNEIRLSGGPQGPQFSDPVRGPRPGALYIRSEPSVPMRSIAEGFAVSGKPAFIVPAQPNMQVTFDLRLQYWIAFGQFQQGEVLDPRMSADAQSKVIYGPPTQVIFPTGINAMTATLSASNSWTIKPG